MDLGEDLPLPEHEAVETGGHPQQVIDGGFVVVSKEVGAQRLKGQARHLAEEGANG